MFSVNEPGIFHMMVQAFYPLNYTINQTILEKPAETFFIMLFEVENHQSVPIRFSIQNTQDNERKRKWCLTE